MTRPATYADVAALLDRLPVLLAREREVRDQTLQDVAQQIGCAQETIRRIELGIGCRLDTATAVLRWLASRPDPRTTPYDTTEETATDD